MSGTPSAAGKTPPHRFMTPPRIGVLALQGAFAAHSSVLRELDCRVIEVRVPADLDGIEALIFPGGESTTISHLLASSGLVDAIDERLRNGMPAFGTCAGMILLAHAIEDGTTDQRSFNAIDIDVRRNAYGRQVDSFETDIDVVGLDRPFHAMFIRAPQMTRRGPGVEVLASMDGDPVLAREGTVFVASFHPELTHDDRLHRLFLGSLKEG